jgi:hypothetical protein
MNNAAGSPLGRDTDEQPQIATRVVTILTVDGIRYNNGCIILYATRGQDGRERHPR